MLGILNALLLVIVVEIFFWREMRLFLVDLLLIIHLLLYLRQTTQSLTTLVM